MPDIENRILNLQLSLYGKWDLDGSNGVSFYFLDSNELDVVAADLPFTMKYECYAVGDLLMIRIINPTDKAGQPQIKTYSVSDIDPHNGILKLKNDKGSTMNFHQDKAKH